MGNLKTHNIKSMRFLDLVRPVVGLLPEVEAP